VATFRPISDDDVPETVEFGTDRMWDSGFVETLRVFDFRQRRSPIVVIELYGNTCKFPPSIYMAFPACFLWNFESVVYVFVQTPRLQLGYSEDFLERPGPFDGLVCILDHLETQKLQ